MQTYFFVAAAGVFLLVLLAWRIDRLKKLHAGTPIDPTPEILGPKEVHRHRL